ncbi:MAG: beta-ketoacyl-ACP synthase II [Nitrospirae bacterium]|nr:beta-ketoacyl-ACP synthase II [Nitrospirota bacterium]
MPSRQDPHRRVVITGLGIVSPIGIGVPEFWKAALEGRSGISAISSFGDFPLESYRCRVAGQIRDFDPRRYLDESQSQRLDRYAQFALVAAGEAVAQAGLRMDRGDPHRVGVMVGAGMGAMMMGEREITQLYQSQRPHRVHPNFIPTITLNSASGLVALAHGAKGPNLTISTACSSSLHAVGSALLSLQAGAADAMIEVGAEAGIQPLVFAGFCNLRALSSGFNETPTQASRPFDRARDGFVMGEGAGALILETLSHARSRKAKIYAEVAGYAGTCEAYHMVIPKEDGVEMADTMTRALRVAQVAPSAVDCINAHATSTRKGDEVEIRGIRRALKARASRVAIHGTKSMIGHTLGAAGAIGVLVGALTTETGQVHPTINYDDPDPECALPGIAAKVQERRIKVTLINAFGFGSNNATVVLKRFS